MATTNLAIAQNIDPEIVKKIVLEHDVAKLNDTEKVIFVRRLCESVGLNYLTQPFQIIQFQGKQKLYASKSCTDQLRFVHNISIQILSREIQEDLFIVQAKGLMPNGRCDESSGAVVIANFSDDGKALPFRGDMRANAIMKAETKAKRRVTLSICGLGALDEAELDTMPGHQFVPLRDGAKQITKMLDILKNAPDLEILKTEYDKAKEYAKNNNDAELHQDIKKIVSERKAFLEKNMDDAETQKFIDELGDPE